MKKYFILCFWLACAQFSIAQAPKIVHQIATTPVKYQANTNTCWCYSTTSMIESECLRTSGVKFNLSEMFTARNMFIEKAKRYMQSNGTTLFEAGGLGHDALYGMIHYGAIPEEFYSSEDAIRNSDISQVQLETALKAYLQRALTNYTGGDAWLNHYIYMLDSTLGVPPQKFTYNKIEYTPLSFATDILKVKAEDYVTITSFTHHPFYEYFALEIPDNYLLEGMYYNVPIDTMLNMVEYAILSNYGVTIDMDVSNQGWNCSRTGFALYLAKRQVDYTGGDIQEQATSQELRQELFDTKVTADDHLIHLIGVARSEKGKRFFVLKDSGGPNYGPFGGFDFVSDAYCRINALSILLPKAALTASMLAKINTTN